MPDWEKFIGASEICTKCIVCGEIIRLGQSSSELVPRMCDKCKDAINFIRRIRSKETVSVVRCKDCKWAWNINPTEEEKFYVCKNPTMVNMRYSHQGDWFCADGVKKDD